LTDHIERDGPGRRNYDKMKCPNCDLLWSNLEKERAANKEYICGKILEVKKDVEKATIVMAEQAKVHSSFVPRWMFGLAFTLLLLVGGWWFSSFSNTVKENQTAFYHSLEKSQGEVKDSLSTLHRRITETDNSREALKDSLTELKWSVNSVSTRLGEVEKQLKK